MKDMFSYRGLFTIADPSAVGHLSVRKHQAKASLVGDLYRLLRNGTHDIHGTLPDSRSVSLLRCICTGKMTFHEGKKRTVQSKIYPNFVTIGHKPVSFDDEVITQVSYECENARALCEYSKAFDIAHPNRESLAEIIKEDNERHETLVPGAEFEQMRPSGRLGEQPVVAFFDGNFEIAELSTPSGILTMSNSVSYGMGSPKGVKISNKVVVTIKFDRPQSIQTVLEDLTTAHSFFELLLGSPQKYMKIFMTLSGDESASTMPVGFHWNRCNSKKRRIGRRVMPWDIPILASTEKPEFESVFSQWMSRSAIMRESRSRLFNGLHSGVYGIDRIVGAANMYDLLPETLDFESESLSSDTVTAIERARKEFRALEQSDARNSVLSALGRLGEPSLRSKIRNRAKVVANRMLPDFAKVDQVIRHAVLCRNHFVHGSEAGFDYRENFASFVFLIDTLEFIFAAADLIDCGWNPQIYLARAGSMSHFIGRYAHDFDQNFIDFRNVTSGSPKTNDSSSGQ